MNGHARVVVVLECGPIDPGPGQPLAEERDEDQGEREAPARVRLPRDEGHRRDPEPPHDQVARVVDRRRRPAGETLLVEPDGLEIERPGPPWRRRRVARDQVVVVVVHLPGQVEERLARAADRPARDELVVVDERPRDVRDDVEPDRDHEQAQRHPDDRCAQQRARPEPRLARRRRGRRQERGRVGRLGRGRERPEAGLAGHDERHVHADRDQDQQPGEVERRDRDAADDDVLVRSARRDRDKADDRPERRRGADREPHLVVRPGDRVEDVDHDRRAGQRDHDHDERQVAEPGPFRDDEREVAEDAGRDDQPEDDQHPAERAPGEDQDPDPADRVQRHPLRGQRESEAEPDQGHDDPERTAPLPVAGPERSEQRVRGEDAKRDVRVVHPDPGLDEEHPVDEGEDPDEDRDLSPPEQDPGQDVQQAGHRGAGEDAGDPPRERVLADLDADHLAARIEGQDLLAVVRRVALVRVHVDRDRVERQRRVGEDRARVAVGLDDVDRRAGPVGLDAEDVDHLGRLVVQDGRAAAGQWHRALPDRTVLGRVAADDDRGDLAR